jgi:lambda family phage portal protein
MIASLIDSLVAAFAPQHALQRAKARYILKRGYAGAEPTRLADARRVHNRPADMELSGPLGNDKMRAWARDLVRNNAYAWGVVDTIVASVVGTGIKVQSALETQDGEDVEIANEMRDSLWCQWCEVCELTGQYNLDELQAIAQREMVEAGECLIHIVSVPLEYRGIRRPLPLALELIEADRLATDRDTYQFANDDGTRIVQGVELDELGVPVAYWVYPAHPQDIHSFRREPVRIPAENILHLYRRDRIGQHRGVTWFSPVVSWMRDLGIYVDNEMQAGAVAACAAAVVKSETPISGLAPPSTSGTSDQNGNRYSFLEPGAFFYLNPGEDISMINPSRPNSGAEPWINLMLRGIAVGTGLSYEIVARDFSQTNYSSNRASQLEDRRRFRRWQRYMIDHMCKPVWKRFCFAAAMQGHVAFPEVAQLAEDFSRFAPADFMPPSWEWVDPAVEQSSSQAAITAFQATYADELGAKGLNWRHVFYQRAKEERLLQSLGLSSPLAQAEALATAQSSNAGSGESEPPPTGTGELANASTLQFKRNRKAIESILGELSEGLTTENKARAYLSSIGLSQPTIDALIADALDGSGQIETEAPVEN